MTIITTIKSNDTIKITFPNDFKISSSVQAFYLGNQLTVTKSANIINLTNFNSGDKIGPFITILISEIINPPSIKPVTGFVVETYRNGYLKDQSTNTITY